MAFEIQREERGKMPLVRVLGELDLLSAPQLLDVVEEVVSGGAESIAFDFSYLTFIDSSGLGVLVRTKRQAAERGGQVYVIGVAGHLRRMFNVIQVGEQFRLCSEEELPAA